MYPIPSSATVVVPMARNEPILISDTLTSALASENPFFRTTSCWTVAVVFNGRIDSCRLASETRVWESVPAGS